MLVHIVKAKLKLNPILMSPETTPGAYLDWNILFSSGTARLSTDPPHKSWSAGRTAPATFPRVTTLMVITTVNTYQWCFEIHAKDPKIGITCGELADGLANDLHKLAGKRPYESLSRDQRHAVGEAYRHNRSRLPGVPGGTLGEGMRRLDYLREYVWWNGLEVVDPETSNDHNNLMARWLDQNPGQGRLATKMPCLLVLRLDTWQSRSQQEVNEWDQSRERRRSESGRSRSRAASNAANTASSVQGAWGGTWPAEAQGGRSRANSRAASRSRAGSRADGQYTTRVLPPSPTDSESDGTD